MAIETRANRISALLTRVKRYDAIVRNDTFTNSALDEMKNNAKDVLDEVKDEVDLIKSEVDNW